MFRLKYEAAEVVTQEADGGEVLDGGDDGRDQNGHRDYRYEQFDERPAEAATGNLYAKPVENHLNRRAHTDHDYRDHGTLRVRHRPAVRRTASENP